MADRSELLIAGAGPAALEAALAVQRLAGDRVRITLVGDREEFVYRPVAVAEPFGLASPERFSVRGIAADRGFGFRHSALDEVDVSGHRVRCRDGAWLPYDTLFLAIGARSEEAVPGALTFRGPEDSRRLREALEALPSGPRRVAFVAGPETAWTLPLYELALLAAQWRRELEPWVVTYEHRPLSMFGEQAATDAATLLTDAGVRLWTGAFVDAFEGGRLWVSMEGGLPVDLVVALPRPRGPALSGLPHDAEGFVEVDDHCRVRGAEDVYAAGDMTSRPVKQGGLATQQADVAATAIAAAAGADVAAERYRPVLRAMLLTGERPRYLRHAPTDRGRMSDDAPWWPPHKISGRELAPYLTAHPELRLESTRSR
jgi:sulfide:quinone oxidoreductase